MSGLPDTTIKGYATYEVLSAMQKEVRRGHEKEALYWALELAESGFFPLAASRLRVTAYEDIGISDKEAVLFAIACLDQSAAWMKAKNDSWTLALADAVLALCRARKTRIGDSFQAAVMALRRKENLPIPDYALDKHTARGRQMGRGIEHFLQVGAQLENEAVDIEDIYLPEASAYWREGSHHRPNGNGESKKEDAQTKSNDVQDSLF